MLERFFLLGDTPYNVETGTYILPLVLLSYVIASFGSFTGLTLATGIFQAKTSKLKNLLHWGGAFALGAGIWSMHFIGMLSYHMDMKISYDIPLTILSMVIAVVVAYCALWVTRIPKLRIIHFICGSILLGVAICSMHYVGMAAMVMDAHVLYKPGLFFLSVLIAVTASGAALFIISMLIRHEGDGRIFWLSLAALIMGAAICGMHYTGLAASVMIPYADCRYDPQQTFEGLALAIAVITSIIFGIALMLGLHNRERMSDYDTNRHDAFPVKLLGLSLSLTLISILWVGFMGFYNYEAIITNIKSNIEITELARNAAETESNLTKYANLMISTGNLSWKEKHQEQGALLHQTLSTIKEKYPDPDKHEQHQGGFVNKTNEAGERLVELGQQAFDLNDNGKTEEAQDLLEGPEYKQYQHMFDEGKAVNFLRINYQMSGYKFSDEDRQAFKESAREGAKIAISSFPEINEQVNVYIVKAYSKCPTSAP